MFAYTNEKVDFRQIPHSGDKSPRFWFPANVQLRPSLQIQTHLEEKDINNIDDVIIVHTNEYSYEDKHNNGGTSSPTAHGSCGYGYDILALLAYRINDTKIYAVIDMWSGCLSYDSEDRESRLWYSNDLNDLFDIIDKEHKELILDKQYIGDYYDIVKELKIYLINDIAYSILMPYLSYGVFF